MRFRVFFHQFPTIFCTFAQTLRVFLCTSVQFCALPASSFSVLLYKLFLHIARKLRLRSAIDCTNFLAHLHKLFSSLPPHFFQLVRNFMTICFQLPCKISQLSAAFSYVTTAFPLNFVSVSTAFSTRNVYASTMFLACIAYATTMFLTCNVYASTMFLIHNTYLSITKYL